MAQTKPWAKAWTTRSIRAWTLGHGHFYWGAPDRRLVNFKACTKGISKEMNIGFSVTDLGNAMLRCTNKALASCLKTIDTLDTALLSN